MKTQERHHLKQNEFVETVQRVTKWVAENRDQATLTAGAALLVILVVGGYFYWQKRTAEQAGIWLGTAMAVAEAPIAPAPSLPGKTQAPNTFPTERARQEAALAAFQEVVKRYPSASAGLNARMEIAATLLALGRLAEAEQAYQDVVKQAPTSFYAPLAKLGLAQTLAAEKQYEKAIASFTDLAAQRDGALPVDGILMQLARTCRKAGKVQEARAAFKRVVDEFPNSPYTTAARQELTQLGS